MLIITSHAALINGKLYEALTNNLLEKLISEKKDFLFIRHFMNGEKMSEVYFYKDGILIKQSKLFVLSSISIIRYLTEITFTFFYILFSNYSNITYIGIDPLNSFTGFLLKKIGRIKKNIFYTPDYSPKRFHNNTLNKVYHFIDRVCVFGSDEVWNVSTRIFKIRESMGLIKEKNIILPNIPGFIPSELLHQEKNQFCLITLGMISEQLDFIGIFDAIKILKEKYPKICLKVIGNGDKEIEYKLYVKEKGIEKHVDFLGYLDHNRALEEISKSGIGLALYNGKWGFNYYGDSIKCREFFSFGLPVLTTNTHSTVDDITETNSGIITNLSSIDYLNGIEKIINNYDYFSENSLNLGKKYLNFYNKKIKSLG